LVFNEFAEAAPVLSLVVGEAVRCQGCSHR